MDNEHHDTARAATIDALSLAARSETDKTIQAEKWRELWREVLPLERWYFIKDDSEEVSPIFLKDGDTILLPVFTDVERAINYAKDFGGKDRVYGSAPGGMITATEELEKSGVSLVVFNPHEEPFAVTPATLKQLAEGYSTSGEGQIVGGSVQLPESEVDALAYFARTHVDDIKAKSALWITTLLLDSWYFVPQGEGEHVQPFAVVGEGGAHILGFTQAKRAAEYAALRGLGQLDAVIEMTPQEAVSAFTATGSKAVSIQFDPQHGSFHTGIKQLPAMLKIAEQVAADQRKDQDDND
ncbi:hypothetical protein [Timonella sp. A28]|uniref:hypothetical protein n=1 Tax=Timonella sp. A28 TaxID=3442640 RepID=UPI003EBA0E34